MKKHRINTILNFNSKERKAFMKFLSSLDFNEFEELLNHYLGIILKTYIKYLGNKKVFSRDWFKKNALKRKYKTIATIFSLSNMVFFMKVSNNMQTRNIKREKLVNQVIENKLILDNLKKASVEFDIKNKTKTEIAMCSLVISIAYTTKQLEMDLDELSSLV